MGSLDPIASSASLRKVGGLIVERTLEGASARRKWGSIDLRPSMLVGGGDSERLIGHATVFGSTLLCTCSPGSAKGDLIDTEHPENRGNAVTEVARTVMRPRPTLG